MTDKPIVLLNTECEPKDNKAIDALPLVTATDTTDATNVTDATKAVAVEDVTLSTENTVTTVTTESTVSIETTVTPKEAVIEPTALPTLPIPSSPQQMKKKGTKGKSSYSGTPKKRVGGTAKDPIRKIIPRYDPKDESIPRPKEKPSYNEFEYRLEDGSVLTIRKRWRPDKGITKGIWNLPERDKEIDKELASPRLERAYLARRTGLWRLSEWLYRLGLAHDNSAWLKALGYTGFVYEMLHNMAVDFWYSCTPEERHFLQRVMGYNAEVRPAPALMLHRMERRIALHEDRIKELLTKVSRTNRRSANESYSLGSSELPTTHLPRMSFLTMEQRGLLEKWTRNRTVYIKLWLLTSQMMTRRMTIRAIYPLYVPASVSPYYATSKISKSQESVDELTSVRMGISTQGKIKGYNSIDVYSPRMQDWIKKYNKKLIGRRVLILKYVQELTYPSYVDDWAIRRRVLVRPSRVHEMALARRYHFPNVK